MKKNLLSLVIGTTTLIPTLSYAVGLGSIKTYSHLNEKLRAEIPVLSIKKEGRMTVSLASNAEFAQRGVPRSDAINDLVFSLVKRGGRTYVNVSSRGQISEPYVNFILRLNTPEGVVSREYAIFLDPAAGSSRKSVPSAPVVRAKPGAPKQEYTPPTRTQRAARSQSRQYAKATPRKQSKPRRPAPLSTGKAVIADMNGARYTVRPGEVLWTIAEHTRPSKDIPVVDMMNAIKRANPTDMPNGNLYAGFTISIPTIKGYPPYSGGSAPLPEASKQNEWVKKNSQAGVDEPVVSQADSVKKPMLPPGITEKKQQSVTAQDSAKQNDALANNRNNLDKPAEKVNIPDAQSDLRLPPADLAGKEVKSTDGLIPPPPVDERLAGKEVKEQSSMNTGADNEGLEFPVPPVSNAGDGTNVTDSLMESGENVLANATDNVGQNLGEVTSGLKNSADAASNQIENGVNQALPDGVVNNDAVNDAVDTVKNAVPEVPSLPGITPEKEPEISQPAVTPESVKPEVAKPAVVAPKPPAPQPVPEKSIVDTVIDTVTDNALPIGGGVVALLGGAWALTRRKKSGESKEIEEITEDDIDDIDGFDDTDEIDSELVADNLDESDFNEDDFGGEDFGDDDFGSDDTDLAADIEELDLDADLLADNSDATDFDDDLLANSEEDEDDLFGDFGDDGDDLFNFDDEESTDATADAEPLDFDFGGDDESSNAALDFGGDEDNDDTLGADLDFGSDNTLDTDFNFDDDKSDSLTTDFNFDDDLTASSDDGLDIDFSSADDFASTSSNSNLDFDFSNDTEENTTSSGLDLDFSDELSDSTVKEDDLTTDFSTDFENFDLSPDDSSDNLSNEATNSSSNTDFDDLSFSLSDEIDDLDFANEKAGKAVDDSELQVKLELAQSFISIDQTNQAKDILEDIIDNASNNEQLVAAKKMLDSIS